MATTRALRAPYGVTRGEFPIPPPPSGTGPLARSGRADIAVVAYHACTTR